MKVKIKFSDLRELIDKKTELKDLKEKYNLLMQHHNDLIGKSENISNLIQEIKELNEENNALSAENNKLKTLSEIKMPKFWFGDEVYFEDVGSFIVRYIEKTDTTFFYSQDNDNYYSESILSWGRNKNEEL